MESKSVFKGAGVKAAGFKAAGVLAVAAGVVFGAVPLVQATQSGTAPAGTGQGALVQLADAAQMAAVKERQELMKSIGGNTKTIADFLKESKGTAAEAGAAAAKISELAKSIPAAFEVDASLSEMDAVGKNRAKPEIWLMWDEFTAHAKTLEEKSAALAGAFQSGDSGAIQAAFGDMGKNGCGGCHEDFRGPKVE
ncbi:MAG: c-type cytochrome [Kiloniellaceae bacterium]